MPMFPPPYSVRISNKAQRISLRIRRGLGLEVILPKKVSNTNPLEVLERFRPWIEQHYSRLCGDGLVVRPKEYPLPQSFQLYGGKSIVSVKHPSVKGQLFIDRNTPDSIQNHKYLYEGIPKFIPRVRDADHIWFTFPKKIEIALNTEEGKIEALLFLRAWIKGKAQNCLVPLLQEASNLYDLPYSTVSFRFQKTRWGSCSIKKSISLNACLVFLPAHLARYIILHELAHTKEMNHSEKFWKVLFTLDTNALAHDKAMRNAWKYVPDWVMGIH